MIPYYDNLPEAEQREISECICQLFKQTFLLERKYEKRTERFQATREYRICGKHFEFIKAYLRISGITLLENSQLGVIYIQGESHLGEKLSRLATLYILILKIIYEEQMETVSASANVYTSLGEMQEKLGSYRLFKKQPSGSEIRRALAVLKKYQLIEPLELMEDLKASSKIVIYPCIHLVLQGDDVRALLASFSDENAEGAGSETDENAEGAESEPDENAEETESELDENQEEEKREEAGWSRR